MNIIKAFFSGGCTQITAAEALWQWDQGQILQIVGLDLPDAYQVEFSNQPVRGAAAPMIGGVGGVEIPDVYLTTGRDIYAFVVLHSGETDRETEYRITIHVNARPQPTDVQPTPEQQGVIDQLIAALNAGVERAEDAADEAEGSAGDAAAQAQAAAQSASSSASYAGDAAAQAGLAAAAKAGAEAAQDAAELAQGSAEEYATAAGVAKAAAETAQGEAEDAQDAAEAAQAAAESAKAGALAAKAAAETAQGKAEDAQEAAEQAAQDAHVEYDLLAGQVTAQGQTIAQHGQAIAQNTADIADLDEDLTRQKSAIEALESLTNRKAGMLVDTASGSIASFIPDSTIPDLLGVSVAVEPVQDLHGYGNPWPAGGGKNLLDPSLLKDQAGWFLIPLEVKPNTLYTCSTNKGTFTATGLYLFFNNTGVSGGTDSTLVNANTPHTVTSTADGLVYVTGRRASGTDSFSNYIVQVEEGSTATALTPYENLCPISGWDSVEVERTGRNLLDPQYFVPLNNIYTVNADKTITIKRTNTEAWTILNAYPLKAGTYTLSRTNTTGLMDVRLSTENYGTGHMAEAGVNSKTFTMSEEGYIKLKVGYSASDYPFTTGVQIEPGSTATEYKPFVGNRYTIALGDTVYGAKLNVTAGTMTVDRAMVDLGALAWDYLSAVGHYRFRAFLPGLKDTPSNVEADMLCSTYAVDTATNVYNNVTDKRISSNGGVLLLFDSAYTDAATFKSAMSGVQLVYELATPITIQLDPVTISTVSGQTTNVWADAGNVSVEFAADLKHYIDTKIAAAVAAMS